MYSRRKTSSFPSKKEGKPVVFLSATHYQDKGFLVGKAPIDTKTVSASIIINWKFSLGEVLASALSGKSIKKPLGELVANIKELDDLVPKSFLSSNSYITRLGVEGDYNDSLVTFYSGFSEFERLIYEYVRTQRPELLDVDIIKRLDDVDKDFFSMRIIPSKIVDGSGNIDDTDPMQRALDMQYENNDVHSMVQPSYGACAHPSFRMLQAEIAIFKGVTATTIKNLASDVPGRHQIIVPINSLLANTMSEDGQTLVFGDKEKFNIHADMLAHIPVKYANTLRMNILKRADIIRQTCMHDIRNLRLAFLPTYIKENWSSVETDANKRLHIRTGKIFDLNDQFNIRMRISIECVYVAIDSSSGAYMVDCLPLNIKKVYRQQDVDKRTGKICCGAKPCFSSTEEEVKVRQAKRTTKLDVNDNDYNDDDDDDDNDDNIAVAASSAPIVNDD